MSDDTGLPFTPYQAPAGSAAPEDPAGFTPGTPEVDANVGGFEEEAPAREYFDLDDDTAQRYVKVKIDGVEQEVTLREALSGYQRQEDYTRKTQEVANLRKEAELGIAMQRAFQANPRLAIQAVADKYGVSLGQANQMLQAQQRQAPTYEPDPYDPDPYDYDPRGQAPRVGESQRQYDQRLARIEQAMEQERVDRILGQAVDGLRNSGADEQDVRDVMQQAMNMRLGPDAFPMIWGNLQFSRHQEAQASAQAQRAQEDQRRQQAAAQAGVTVGSGSSAAGAGYPPPPQTEFDDIHSAFEAAWQQHVGS